MAANSAIQVDPEGNPAIAKSVDELSDDPAGAMNRREKDPYGR